MINSCRAKKLDEAATAAAAAVRVEAEAPESSVVGAYGSCHLDALRSCPFTAPPQKHPPKIAWWHQKLLAGYSGFGFPFEGALWRQSAQRITGM